MILTTHAPALQQAHSQWKSLNAWLYGRADTDASYVQQLDFVADEIGELLAAAFFPWQVSPEDSGDMQHHERNMIGEAGNIGTFIMSQPSGYAFRWSADAGGGTSTRSLIMIPGFWKVSDEKGRPLDQPQLISSPFIVRV